MPYWEPPMQKDIHADEIEDLQEFDELLQSFLSDSLDRFSRETVLACTLTTSLMFLYADCQISDEYVRCLNAYSRAAITRYHKCTSILD